MKTKLYGKLLVSLAGAFLALMSGCATPARNYSRTTGYTPSTPRQSVQPPPPSMDTACYTIDIQVEFSSEITQGDNRVMVELRKGSPGNSRVFDTKYFSGSTATVSFTNMPAGSYFIAVGNGDSVAVGPVRQFSQGQRVHTRVRVTQGAGNVGTKSRSSL